jgi:hypothetical protein
MKVDKTSNGATAPTYVISDQNAPIELAIDGRNVYWTNTGAVTEAPLAGVGPRTLGTVVRGDGIAIDDAYVYYIDMASVTTPGGVYRVAK